MSSQPFSRAGRAQRVLQSARGTRADTRTIGLPGPVNLAQTLGHLRLGRSDPSCRIAGDSFARASWTPSGAVTMRIDVDAPTATATATAAGPGRDWALAHAGDLLGVHDDASGFDPTGHEVVARFATRLPGLRIGRCGLVADLLGPTILAQKVTGTEAVRAWRHLTSLADRPAPTGHDLPPLQLPPPAALLAGLPTWQYTAAGVDRSRARTMIEAHRRIDRLQEAAEMPGPARRTRLTALRGMGPWTAATLERHVFGDPDAVEVGDFHLANHVAWNLAREPRADDRRMLELLEPFTGHRGRAVRILQLAGQRPPAYGPRLAPRTFGASSRRARTRPSKGR